MKKIQSASQNKKATGKTSKAAHTSVIKPTHEITSLHPSVVEDHQINYWLGGHSSGVNKLFSDFDVVKLSHTGITKGAVDVLSSYIGISRKNMAETIFDVSVKTMERKDPMDKMDKKTSSHALEIARVVQHAYEVFRNEEKVKLWFNRQNNALNNMKPIELFDTLTGLNLVNDVLGRIEEGVYS